ncbi:hypothetical protein B0H13DRAFT_1851822 [Mycena leptocephala]|nr:hypothetical protein B0H13DRAFT_1851822 [Mycena leptocephala]
MGSLLSSVRAEQPAQSGSGTDGGVGLGPVWDAPAVPVDSSLRILLPRIETVVFCKNYDLDDEICKLLTDQGYDSVNSLFEEDETKLLKELHFKVGHIAELKWALKTCCCWSTQKSKSRIRKGSIHPEGKEVLAEAVVKRWSWWDWQCASDRDRNLSRFAVISGGIGGAGGAAGVQDQSAQGHIGTAEEPEVVTTGPGRIVQGGKGEAGGRGVQLGGTGGVGGASQIPVLYIGFFKRISGGIGGPGGYADNEGGHGGVGEANIFPSLISPIDDETRRQIQPMPLENLEISTKLRERLKDHGFRTVGGLFEAYEQDVQQPGFKPGNLADLKAVLRKVAAQKMVYHALEPYNLTAVGGRTSNVGVAGFLLGGGVSFLSLEHGFGSDNVVAYEVVLADGSICVITPHSHRDLYWALKYGSTNFGIVTRFDMSTFPHLARTPPSRSLVNFTAALADDPKGMSAFGLLWNSDAQDYIIWAHTMRMASHAEITDEVNDLFGGGVRARWFTMTLRPDVQILLDIHKRGAAAFEPDRHRSGLFRDSQRNPLTWDSSRRDRRTVGIPLGCPPTTVISSFQEFCEWAENEARQRGQLHRFVYMNYALGTQRVMESIGNENLAKMRKIQEVYDPQGLFKNYWKGGYNL